MVICLLTVIWIQFTTNDNLSSSSYRATSTDIPDPLSPLLPIIQRFCLVLRVTSCILTELLYAGLSWLPCFCSAMWGGPSENITYELIPASPVHLALIVFVMGGRWPYSCCFVGCCPRTCSKLLTAFLCSCRQAFSPSI